MSFVSIPVHSSAGNSVLGNIDGESDDVSLTSQLSWDCHSGGGAVGVQISKSAATNSTCIPLSLISSGNRWAGSGL